MRYLIVLTAAGRRLSDTTFGVESAFADHLRAMFAELKPRFTEMVVAMGGMNDADYDAWKSSLSVIDEAAEHIRFVPVFTWHASHTRFLRELPSTTRKLKQLVADADLVHSHPTYDLFKPVENIASAFALLGKRKLVAVTDMDNRNDATMNRALGRWSTKSYLLCKYCYDPVRHVQQRAYVRFADLMLFKEPQQVDDYGAGAPHVRLFLDPNFHRTHIVRPDVVARKRADLADPAQPLRLLYFGRLVAYKGVARMVDALARAQQQGAHVTLDIMGAGEERAALDEQARRVGVGDRVRFIEPRPYGEEFFDVLRARHALLACPLSADTPRSTWDAFASAMPIIAFDTPFYRGIGKYTGAVDLVPWPDAEALGDRIAALAKDKRALIPLVDAAVRAAQQNTGEDWLKRRAAWIDELYTGRYSSIGKSSGAGILSGTSMAGAR